MISKTIKIQEQMIHYLQAGNQGPAVLLLHGWGVDASKYTEISVAIEQMGFQVFALDLPGFGKSPEPQLTWSVERYSNCVQTVITQLRLSSFIVIGHSFGGAIATILASKSPIGLKGLILLAAKGIKHPLTWKQSLLYTLAKMGKKIFSFSLLKPLAPLATQWLYKKAGTKDYVEASPKMKKIMQQVLDLDITPYLHSVQVPTLIVWGEKDHSTPVSDAYVMKSKIKQGTLHVLPDLDHGFVYKQPEKVIPLIQEFISQL